MAMNGALLGQEIKAEMIVFFGSPSDSEKLENFCNALAEKIVYHITSNAVISGTVTSGMGAGGTIEGVVT